MGYLISQESYLRIWYEIEQLKSAERGPRGASGRRQGHFSEWGGIFPAMLLQPLVGGGQAQARQLIHIYPSGWVGSGNVLTVYDEFNLLGSRVLNQGTKILVIPLRGVAHFLAAEASEESQLSGLVVFELQEALVPGGCADAVVVGTGQGILVCDALNSFGAPAGTRGIAALIQGAWIVTQLACV